MPDVAAIQPACRPMTSTIITRLWLSAVVWMRSIASVAMATAVSKPIDWSVPQTSLSIVLGIATIRTPASATLLAACSVPSPPMQMSASIRSDSSVDSTASSPPSSACGWYRAVPSSVPPTASWLRMCWRVSGQAEPVDHAAPPVAEADDRVPVLALAALDDGADRGVQAGDVAAAREQTDSHAGTP